MKPEVFHAILRVKSWNNSTAAILNVLILFFAKTSMNSCTVNTRYIFNIEKRCNDSRLSALLLLLIFLDFNLWAATSKVSKKNNYVISNCSNWNGYTWRLVSKNLCFIWVRTANNCGAHWHVMETSYGTCWILWSSMHLLNAYLTENQSY